MDYSKILGRNFPDDPDFCNVLVSLLKNNAMDQSAFPRDVLQFIDNGANNRGGSNGQSNNSGSFFGRGANDSGRGGGGGGGNERGGGFFGSGGAGGSSFFSSNNSSGGGFFGGKNNSSNGSGGGFFGGSSNNSSGGFFGNNNSSGGNGFFRNNGNSGNSGYGFFNNNNSGNNNNNGYGFLNNNNNSSGGYGFFNNQQQQGWPPSFAPFMFPPYFQPAPAKPPKSATSDEKEILEILDVLPEEKKELVQILNMSREDRRQTIERLVMEREFRRNEMENRWQSKQAAEREHQRTSQWLLRPALISRFNPDSRQAATFLRSGLSHGSRSSLGRSSTGWSKRSDTSRSDVSVSLSRIQSFLQAASQPQIASQGRTVAADISVQFRDGEDGWRDLVSREARVKEHLKPFVLEAFLKRRSLPVSCLRDLLENASVFVNSTQVIESDARLDAFLGTAPGSQQPDPVRLLVLVNRSLPPAAPLLPETDSHLPQHSGFRSMDKLSPIGPRDSPQSLAGSWHRGLELGRPFLPTKTNAAYSTEPGFALLLGMSEDELAAVEGFAVENCFGKIKFLGPVDLRGFDFDLLVYISRGKVDLYPEDVVSPEDKPRLGEGLNVPALVTFYNIDSPKSADPESHWRKVVGRRGGDFVSYDANSKTLQFKVYGF